MTRQVLERAGLLALAQTDGVYELLWDGMFLMSSECRASERDLGTYARARTLIGGLGMGFTLRAALGQPDVSGVDVVEISQSVIEWNRTGPLGPLAGHPLSDPRVTCHRAELGEFLDQAGPTYDAILLDVDNGPSWTARPENDALYSEAGLERLAGSLQPGGVLAIWSAQDEVGFLPTLSRYFREARTHRVPVTVADRASHDYIFVAREPIRPRRSRSVPSLVL